MLDPFLDAGMRGFIVNKARENMWRMDESFELEDLIQEGYVCYTKCRYHPNYTWITVKNHPGEDDRRRFQALVSRSFENHIHTLSTKRTRLHEQAATTIRREDETHDAFFDKRLDPEPEAGTFAALMAGAPPELLDLIKILSADGAAAIEYMRKRVKANRVRLVRGGPNGWKQLLIRETNNEHFCNLLGLDPARIDVVGKIRAYLAA